MAGILLSHKRPEKHSIYTDTRHLTLRQTEQTWSRQFLGRMKDVSTPFLSLQRVPAACRPVACSLQLWTASGPLPRGCTARHIILQYPLDHAQILGLGYLRPSACETTTVTVTSSQKHAVNRLGCSEEQAAGATTPQDLALSV